MVSEDIYNDFCAFIGWADLLRFRNCVPTKRGHKVVNNANINTYKVPAGYKMPKKKETITTPPSLQRSRSNLL